MSNFKYGVLVGRVTAIEADPPRERTPHYTIVVETEGGEKYNALINCESNMKIDSLVLYYTDEDFKSEIVDVLKTMDTGFHEINRENGENSNLAIDYLRSGLFNPDEMKPLPYDIKGDNDLRGHIDKNMQQSLNNESAYIYIFGTIFNNGGCKGIHNIHMNQGNKGKHLDENQTYQDGCIFLHFTDEERWVAYFLAFQNQSLDTNEQGHPILTKV